MRTHVKRTIGVYYYTIRKTRRRQWRRRNLVKYVARVCYTVDRGIPVVPSPIRINNSCIKYMYIPYTVVFRN